MKSYNARKYVENSGDPQIVTLRVEATYLVVSENGGDHSLNLSDLELQLTGQDGDRVRLDHKPTKTAFLITDKDILAELEKSNSNIGQKATHAHKKVRSAPMRRLMYFASIFGLLGAIAATFYFSFDYWVEQAMKNIPPSAESAIGDIFADSEKLDSKSEMAKRVNTIGQRLVAHLDKDNPYKFRFFIENKEELNAYAVPGGTIVVLKKLVNDAKSDHEIAGVLAHEIGHVKNRDTLRHLLHSGGIGLVMIILFGGNDKNDQVRAIVPWLQQLESLNYSRAQESAADETAIYLTLKSGYKPEALIDLFSRFAKEEPEVGKAAFALLSDHPMSTDRIAMIKREAAAVREQLKAKGDLAPPAAPIKIVPEKQGADGKAGGKSGKSDGKSDGKANVNPSATPKSEHHHKRTDHSHVPIEPPRGKHHYR